MSSTNVDKEIAMCSNLIEKFQTDLDDCKKDYEFLKAQEKMYGETEEHRKAVAVFKERSDGIKVVLNVLKQRLDKLNEKKGKTK